MSDGSLERRTTELHRAIDTVLLAQDQGRRWLKDDHPPWDADLAAGVQHYGGPSAAFDLWCVCRAIERLRVAWTGTASKAEPPKPEDDPPASEPPS